MTSAEYLAHVSWQSRTAGAGGGGLLLFRGGGPRGELVWQELGE